jgi:hypothetical protein
VSEVRFSRPALEKFAVALSVLFVGAAAFAHATLVLGTLTSDPAAPRPAEPFTITVELVDPTQVPVEDAWVLAEFHQPGAPAGSEPVTARFEEGETPGVYQARVTLPERGAYALRLRDQTYRQEEAQAELTFSVGSGTSPENLSFVFPPTATGPQSLTVWLAWLIGLPLSAAIIVTVLVLRRGGTQETAEGQAGPPGERA